MDGHWSTCIRCESKMWLPQPLYEAAYAARPKFTFYCAYGHGQVFAEGESEMTKLRRERDRLAQRIAEKDDEIAARDRQLVAAKGQVTKAKKRAAAGLCPCCNRTFSNMSRHMSHMHPDYKAEVVEFKATA